MSTTRPSYDVPTISSDALPRLTSWQRSRLVKSTRKLAKILGETPVSQITLPSPESLPPQTKSRDIIQEYPRNRILNLTKKLARTAFEPIQVVLRRDPDSDSEGAHSTNSESAGVGTSSRGRNAPTLARIDSRACHISQVTTNSSSPIEPSYRRRRPSLTSISSSELILSPTEWEEREEEREARSRRKRLSKLTRHLGESIPPDLILPNITYSKLKNETNTPGPPPVVPDSPTVHSAAPSSEQGTVFYSPTLPSPISETQKPTVVRTVDSLVGSIGRSLSHRFNADVTSPRLLARRLRRSRSDSTLSQSREHLTLLRPDTSADEPIDVPASRILDQLSPLPPQGLSSPLPGTSPDSEHHSEHR